MSVKGAAVSDRVTAPVRPIIIQDLVTQNKRKPHFLIFERNRDKNIAAEYSMFIVKSRYSLTLGLQNAMIISTRPAMERNPMQKFRHLSSIASILIVLCYLTFAILAYIQFPLPYSPLTNWLSDLGNVDLNPHGATLYNIGIISTAVLLVSFFLGLIVWKMEKNKIQTSCYF